MVLDWTTVIVICEKKILIFSMSVHIKCAFSRSFPIMTEIEKVIGGLVLVKNHFKDDCPVCDQCSRADYCQTRRLLLRNISICIARCWKTYNYHASEKLAENFDRSVSLNSTQLTTLNGTPERRQLFTRTSTPTSIAPEYEWPDETDGYVWKSTIKLLVSTLFIC